MSGGCAGAAVVAWRWLAGLRMHPAVFDPFTPSLLLPAHSCVPLPSPFPPPPYPPRPRLPMPRPGQVLGLVGTNGIGKSTALKVLAGKLKPNLGRFTVRGEKWVGF